MVDVTTTTFGSTATYTCNSGYTLTGDTTSTCGATGQWSSSAPTCDCKLLAIVWSYVLLTIPINYSILILNIRTPLVHIVWINTCMLSMRKIQKFPHMKLVRYTILLIPQLLTVEPLPLFLTAVGQYLVQHLERWPPTPVPLVGSVSLDQPP